MKSKKQALLTSGLCLGLSAALLTGATFAWFTDSVTNKGNTIQAGNLDVQLFNDDTEITNESKEIFTYDKWEPGYSTGANLTVKNNGTLAIKYELELQNITTTKDIEDVIDVYVGGQLKGTLADFMNGEDLMAGTLSAGVSTEKTAVKLAMQTSAGNQYQGATASFDILLKAAQTPEEEDGFGNKNYDADAPYEQITVEAGANAAENGKALQRAVEEASEGALVLLPAGEYQLPQETYASPVNGSLTCGLNIDKSITIVGSGDVVIDSSVGGYNSGMVLISKYDVDVVLDGITFEGGAWDLIGCDDPGVRNVTITNCQFNSTGTNSTPIKLKLLEGNISNNTFAGTNCGYGVRIIGLDKRDASWNGSVPSGLTVNIQISNNDFSGFGINPAHTDRGVVQVSTGDQGTVTISKNNFSDTSSTYVIKNDNSVAVVDASGNYWGDVADATQIMGKVNGSVTVSNYYSDADMTRLVEVK